MSLCAAAYSINYVLDDKDVTIKDANGDLKKYQDADTKSGNAITVRLTL